MKTRLACSIPSLDTQEFAATVEAWCEILHTVIPIEKLNVCYLRAMRERDSTFPLAATELIQAWREVRAEDAARNRVPCAICEGTGYGLAYDPKNDVEFQKECPYCFGRVTTSLESVQ